MNYQAIIQTKLNDLLQQEGQAPLEGKAIHFADDDSVSYENWTVRKSDVFDGDSIDCFLQNKAEGRSWIHANLMRIDDKDFLVTIRAGAKAANPNPSVNVSFELNQLVKIIC